MHGTPDVPTSRRRVDLSPLAQAVTRSPLRTGDRVTAIDLVEHLYKDILAPAVAGDGAPAMAEGLAWGAGEADAVSVVT